MAKVLADRLRRHAKQHGIPKDERREHVQGAMREMGYQSKREQRKSLRHKRAESLT
jgi:DNA-binding LacI/PurR family transcriptional regulator